MVTLALSLAVPLLAGPDSFPYVTWTNTAGHSFEARFDHLDGDKLVLRAKKGGKRYPVKIDTLSAESRSLFRAYQTETTNKLKTLQTTPGDSVPVELAYRAVALGVTDKLTALRHRKVQFTIDKIRVRDRLSAILELEGGCVRILQAPKGREFFLQTDDLYTRPSQKDNRIPYPKRTNAEARLAHERGGICTVTLQPGMNVAWDRIGVNDGPVFR